ncbi:MAG: AAA family ATPase [Myxococcales bacterium]|nr:AAA family ATPase [Myxococcales bacterium]MDP3500949.1 AAA family ATPase [Myxococcales bacterium]
MLKKLRVQNYRTFEDFEFVPGRGVSVLIGENGSGKSALGEVLEMLVKFTGGASLTELFSARSLCRWTGRFASHFNLTFDGPTGEFEYQLSLMVDSHHLVPSIASESVSLDGKKLYELQGGDVWLSTAEGPLGFSIDGTRSWLGMMGSKTANTTLAGFPSAMSGLRTYKFEVSRMLATSEREAKELSRDASNFASWFTWFSQNHLELIPQFFELMRSVLPGFVSLKPVDAGAVKRLVARFSINGRDQEFGFEELSDGQRQLLCLYLLTLSIEPGQLLFFDEPDNFLSIREVQPWLAQLERVAELVGAQVLVASHGTEAMNYLGSRKAWLLSRPNGAGTVSSPVDGDDGTLPSEVILYGPAEVAAE